tara:strand:- start:1391 stop:1534 length:144 start_codon:yes stop_codon:yes gene_type:complete
MSFRERERVIKTINKFNQAKQGKQGGEGDFDTNVMPGDFGFDPVDLK